MNSSNEFQMVGKQGIHNKSILTQKKFQLNNLQWDYQNHFNLALSNSDELSSKLQIRNHLCEMNGNMIKKITQIVYKDQIFTIEDTYSLYIPENQMASRLEQLPREQKETVSTNDSDKNDTKDKDNQKKVYIFKKMRRRRLIKQGQDQQLRNTKNISKNFCKAFVAFLKSQKAAIFQRKNIREAIQTYNSLLQHKKYNNNLIKKIISNEILRNLFQYFLEQYAKNWISQSRVNDKPLHYEAINIYLSLFNTLPLLKQVSQSQSSSEESPSHEQEK